MGVGVGGNGSLWQPISPITNASITHNPLCHLRLATCILPLAATQDNPLRESRPYSTATSIRLLIFPLLL
jgi:hypothetical protein